MPASKRNQNYSDRFWFRHRFNFVLMLAHAGMFTGMAAIATDWRWPSHRAYSGPVPAHVLTCHSCWIPGSYHTPLSCFIFIYYMKLLYSNNVGVGLSRDGLPSTKCREQILWYSRITFSNVSLSWRYCSGFFHFLVSELHPIAMQCSEGIPHKNRPITRIAHDSLLAPSHRDLPYAWLSHRTCCMRPNAKNVLTHRGPLDQLMRM